MMKSGDKEGEIRYSILPNYCFNAYAYFIAFKLDHYIVSKIIYVIYIYVTNSHV